MDINEELHARAVEALQAIAAFEGTLRRAVNLHGTRPTATALGLPPMTVHRWQWGHSARWKALVVDRLKGPVSA